MRIYDGDINYKKVVKKWIISALTRRYAILTAYRLHTIRPW